ncbi:Permease of the major facilitator superfamily [Phaffia rhodozyma]|uniref:Permease of the major facilitator superfamily n=1 Tax=Phaffia rhodozyma TaxID=264483 RepID=A0A0F7SLG8_PHARH|nr:Permease of the major facilitator superfamily [Phaffia rhodozyma]
MSAPHHHSPIAEPQPVPSARSNSVTSTISAEDKKLYDDKVIDQVVLASDIPPLADRASIDGNATIGSKILIALRLKKRPAVHGLDSIATQPSVYDTAQAEFYKPRSDWENISFFDPLFRWTWREEKTAVRKIDLKIMAWVLVMFLALDIDRSNISTATADNLLDDLNLTQGDYNLGTTLARLGFLLAELPSQLISKRLGPDRWIPIQIVIFSLISGAQFFMKGRSSFLAIRFLIAAFQGGFIPDIILYLSYFYTKNELPVRLSFFWSINYVADMLVGFLAVGLLQMRGVLGYAGWRWMFLIEGLFTFVIGIASFWLMPSDPVASSVSRKWRPNGYLTKNEAKIIVNRSVRDDHAKGGMHNRQPLTLSMIKRSLFDYDLYPLYFIGLTFGIAAVPVKQYLQLSFKTLGFSTINANLLSIPNTVISIINLLAITAISELVDNRSFVSMAENLWMLPLFIALDALPSIGAWQYFAIATVLLGFPYVHAIQVSWCSRNSGSVRTRTVSASVYNMAVQLSSIIGANVYQASDKPRYHKANRWLIGILCFNLIIVYPGTYFYYGWRNASKNKIWDAMTSEEKSEYLATTTDEGNKRLDFQFSR